MSLVIPMGIVRLEYLLLAPWFNVSFIGKAFLVLQVGVLLLTVSPAVRRRLRASSWVGPLVVGPPLLWVLVEASVGLLFVAEMLDVHGIGLYVLQTSYSLSVICTTVLLQAGLRLALNRNPLHAFPLLGIITALLAIIGDTVLVIYCVSQ